MRYLSVCSGIEAASVAWHSLGWTPVGFAEIEPFPCEVLKQRFPAVKNYGNLENYEQWQIEPGTVDVLVGGPPCQAFSVAGLREGMADPRGNLSLIYFGLVQRLRPKWIVYENVPGLLSSKSGSDFSSLITALAECGYGFAYRVLDASHFGLAQRRKRVFLVGCRTGDWRHPTAVLFDGPSSFGHPPKGEKEGQVTASPSGASVGGASKQLPFGTRSNPDVANCLETTCHDYSRADGFNMVVNHISRNDERCEALPVSDDRASFNQGENALYDPFIGHTDTCPTIISKGPHAVLQPFVVQPQQLLYENHPQDSRVTGPHNIAPTVAAKFGTGGGNVPLGQGADPVTWQPGNLRRDAGADPSTVATTTLKASMGDQMPHIATPMAVRRLLPSECEALQGFPKDWTKISWRGKSPDECPDGPRYKAIGNSMAVNCMHWIGRRIQLVEDIISETK